jgi:hypothetical protein
MLYHRSVWTRRRNPLVWLREEVIHAAQLPSAPVSSSLDERGAGGTVHERSGAVEPGVAG